ncbi:hypothetical protein EJ06DRAFT_562138 [Trichodelitschia bisporula]|uniref:Uncharacterized protein n=1 Tax=Trichodelitschia bisporula TaxID=703511 RepID=A0A6G1HVW4_9PEZI|nr:hypothetical protein EJ06DRAFT_562138 [Trichodelitschia bisporula]
MPLSKGRLSGLFLNPSREGFCRVERKKFVKPTPKVLAVWSGLTTLGVGLTNFFGSTRQKPSLEGLRKSPGSLPLERGMLVLASHMVGSHHFMMHRDLKLRYGSNFGASYPTST